MMPMVKVAGFVLAGALLAQSVRADNLDLSGAVVVSPPGTMAATVLVEEIAKRTGIKLQVSGQRPAEGAAIVIAIHAGETGPEGYRLRAASSTVSITASDVRGALYGVGALLRRLDWGSGKLQVATPIEVTTSPAYPIRGHQLGYRSTANSWDAWTPAQFEQYIRELAFFGVNSIENIPFQDERQNPLMKVPRREMSRAMSEICKRYGIDYWVWTPADFDLNDAMKRAGLLEKFDQLFADSVELTGVFFPGGDPGSNPPELVLPLLKEVGERLRVRHPKARVWLSLQQFSAQQIEAVYQYIDREQPEWLAGLVAGPSSPPIAETRQRLSKRFKLRLYPDLTHNKICQYQVPYWDQAYALTLGREAVNPRPAEFALIHNRYAAYSDGFISYSDGVHDDVNKTIWSALAWDPSQNVRDILIDYARLYFSPAVAEEAADAILALEKNWRGPLIENGAVESTRATWQALEKRSPQLDGNWRWQMCLLRANYDAYVRRRLINETSLEAEANHVLMRAGSADRTMDEALKVLNRAVDQPVGQELRARIFELCEKLFQSIGLQTSVEKYYASGAERGAVLDFAGYPLNNRWWLEDEFKQVRGLSSEEEKIKRLKEIATWENPGPGSYYDDIGNDWKSPHVIGDAEASAESRAPEPMFWWWDNGKSRARLSWQTTMWPARMEYEGLDPDGTYLVRSSGYGRVRLRINGRLIEPSLDGKEMGEFKEFPVPADLVRDRRLVLVWERPTDEEHLNWRRRSRLAEVWVLKK